VANKRRLTGWPPDTGKPASAAELARARQTGVSVRQLRHEEQRVAAANLIAAMLVDDRDTQSTFFGTLSTERRWALHLAEAVLRGNSAGAR